MSGDCRYVCDTNLLISSLLSSNTPSAQTVDLIIDQGVLLFSSSTYDELQTILLRAKFDRYLTKDKRLDFLHSLKAIIEWVEIRENITACRDPKNILRNILGTHFLRNILVFWGHIVFWGQII